MIIIYCITLYFILYTIQISTGSFSSYPFVSYAPNSKVKKGSLLSVLDSNEPKYKDYSNYILSYIQDFPPFSKFLLQFHWSLHGHF